MSLFYFLNIRLKIQTLFDVLSKSAPMSTKGKQCPWWKVVDLFAALSSSQVRLYSSTRIYCQKDHYLLDLLDLPHYSFMLKLTELTNNSEACLTLYRSKLTSRANSLRECSTGNLSPENQQRRALRHLKMLGIVISWMFYRVIQLKLISEKMTIE